MRRRLLPSLNALVAFEATVRHGSIVQAAAELHLSTSAVSRAVRQIEDALQVVLFDRVRQRVVLTEAGRAYGQVARQLLDELEQTTFRVMAYGVASGSLSLGVFSTFASKWLIPRLPSFQKPRPGVIVSCFIHPKPFDFDEHQLDAAIHYGEPVWPGAMVEPLFGDLLVPVAGADLAMSREFRGAADLLDLPLLHELTRPLAWHDWFKANGVESRHTLQGARFDQFTTVAAAAAAGLGIGLIPLFLIQDEIKTGRLKIVLNRPLPGPHKYHFVYPHRSAGSKLLEEFRTWIVAEAAKAQLETLTAV